MYLYGMTDIGKVRETNQDVFYTHKFDEENGFMVVCDGMGGQNGGNIASDMTCGIVSEYLISNDVHKKDENEIMDMIVNSLSIANSRVYEKSNVEPGYKGMGTTAVVFVVVNNKAYIGHIGDSRAYVLKNNKLTQITKDHSVVQELLEQGKINEKEVKNHPNKHMITRAVGVNITVDIDVIELELFENEKVLLCTDGLTNMVSDDTIEKILKKNNAKEVCLSLIDKANKNGGRDNITVAVAETGGKSNG